MRESLRPQPAPAPTEGVSLPFPPLSIRPRRCTVFEMRARRVTQTVRACALTILVELSGRSSRCSRAAAGAPQPLRNGSVSRNE